MLLLKLTYIVLKVQFAEIEPEPMTLALLAWNLYE